MYQRQHHTTKHLSPAILFVIIASLAFWLGFGFSEWTQEPQRCPQVKAIVAEDSRIF